MLSYTLCVMRRLGAPGWVRLTALLLYDLSPCYAGWATVIAKDTMFQISFLLMVTLLWEFLRDRKGFFESWRRPVLLGASFLVMALSRHNGLPLAAAVLEEAAARGLDIPAAEGFEAVSGRGVLARAEGHVLRLGNEQMLREAGIDTGALSAQAEALAAQGKTPVYLARDGAALGVLAMADKLRQSSREAVESLRRMGLRTVMLTGDHARAAEAIARASGVDDFEANVLPGDKAERVKKLMDANGPVAMVGDGINDAPALTAADTGIAIGAGADVAIDAADVVLMKSTLLDVAAAIRLSRAALRNIHENLFWAFIYNVIGIPLAAGVFVGLGLTLNPMYGAAAMSLSSFCVVSNALRLNLFKLRDNRHDHKRTNHLNDIKEEQTMEKTLEIKGMMCPHCEATVRTALEAMPQVQAAQVSHESGTAVVTLTAPVEDDTLRRTVEDKGYTVTAIR